MRFHKMHEIEVELLSKLWQYVIKKADWADTPLTDAEKQIIKMAVSTTYQKIAETQPLNLSRILESVTEK